MRLVYHSQEGGRMRVRQSRDRESVSGYEKMPIKRYRLTPCFAS